MSNNYYKPCKELDLCNELIEKYWNREQYDKCFEGHLVLAEQGYPLAECQVGYFYYDGLGVEKDLEKALYWTRRAAEHGDRDGQCNLAWFYEDGIGVNRDLEQAKHWYRKAALQDHDLAIAKCKELDILLFASNLMQESDIDLVIPIYIDHYNNYEDGEWTYETTKKRIHQVWSREDSLCLLLKSGNEIIGFVMGYFEQYDDLKAYDLVEIVIAHKYQGHGIGTQFMGIIEDKVKSMGGAMIQLEAVNDEMHNRFYSKLNYKDCTNLVLKSKWL